MSADTRERTDHTGPRCFSEGIEQVPRRPGEAVDRPLQRRHGAATRRAPEAGDRALEPGYRTLRTGAIGPRAAPTSGGDRRYATTTVCAGVRGPDRAEPDRTVPDDQAEGSARIVPHGGERFELMHTELELHGDTVVVVAYGEIDLSCAGRLEARLRGLLGCARRLVLDLSGVRFMDSSGLHCVLDVHHASRAAGVEFTLLPGPPQVQRIFRITKTDEIVRFVAVRPARRLAPKGSLR